MISKARQIVKDVLNRFYTEHHTSETLETDLTNEINGGRIGGFSLAKRTVVEAIDHRIDKYTAEACFENGHNSRMIDELQKLRLFVKGMVVKVDE